MSGNTLLAYYSMSGNTRRIADELGKATGADIEEIGEPKPRQGIGGAIRALVDGITRRTPPIRVVRHDPAEYDLVIIGGPVWAGRLAAPVRTYAKRYGSHAPHVAFFCTGSGSDADAAFTDLQTLCQRAPEATLAVDAEHLPEIEHQSELSRFTEQIAQTRH